MIQLPAPSHYAFKWQRLRGGSHFGSLRIQVRNGQSSDFGPPKSHPIALKRRVNQMLLNDREQRPGRMRQAAADIEPIASQI